MNAISATARRVARTLPLPALAVCVVTASAVMAQPTSIQDFMAREPQFAQLVGAVFQLEGRATALSGDELVMKGASELRFVCQSKFERPRKLPHVQLVGRLERDSKGYYLAVTSLSDYKSESDVIRERIRAGDTADPQMYFDLAQWVEDRGAFYQDAALREEAVKLRFSGVQAARRRIAADAPGDFLALADRAAQWGLDPRLRMELLHAATRADLLAESRNRQPAYAAVLEKIRSRFPGAEQPLAELPQATRDEYQKRPDETYAAADPPQRVVLHRLLFLEAAIKLADAEALPDGSNGATVAATIERLAPERPDLPAKYRAADLDYLESRIPRLDRAGVLEFRNKLRAANQPDRATAAVRAWIDQQLLRRPKGPAADVERAELEFEMTQDTERALALASAALNIDPQTPGGNELLAVMGYGWYQGKPVRKELIPAAAPDPLARAMQEGRILAGMTAAQVRASLGGEPDTIVRMASQGGVTELWHYAGQRLTLHLESTRQKPQLVVARILELKSPASTR